MLSGYKNCGKDWVAEKLHEHIVDSKVLAFAEPMKDILSKTLGVTLEEFDKCKNEESNVLIDIEGEFDYININNVRQIIQRFGNEAMKTQFGETVWSDLLVSKLPEEGIVIVSDWRFLIEHDVVFKVANILTVRIQDDNLSAGEHASERELDSFDFDIVLNNTPKSDEILNCIQRLARMVKKLS